MDMKCGATDCNSSSFFNFSFFLFFVTFLFNSNGVEWFGSCQPNKMVFSFVFYYETDSVWVLNMCKLNAAQKNRKKKKTQRRNERKEKEKKNTKQTHNFWFNRQAASISDNSLIECWIFVFCFGWLCLIFCTLYICSCNTWMVKT